MLRPAGDMSGFGGRPPVNIQINFVPGDTSAFKAGVDDSKMLNTELDRGNALLRERNKLLREQPGTPGAPGAPGGGANPWRPSPGGPPSSPSPSYPGYPSHPGYPGSPVPPVPPATPPAPTPAPQSPSDRRSIDRMIENIERRRQGLPDLPDPTLPPIIPGAVPAGGVAGAGVAGLALPATLAAGLVALAAANTDQGRKAIGGWGHSIGSTIESYTRPDGFVDQFTQNLIPGRDYNPVARAGMAAGEWMLEPWRDEARTAKDLSAAEARARFIRFQAQADDLQASADVQSQLRATTIPNALDGTIYGAQQTNRAQIEVYERALNQTVNDDPQSGLRLQGKERAEKLEGLIEARKREVELARQAHAETVGYWRTTLQGLNKELDMRNKVADLAEKEANARTASYAEQSPSKLRSLERAYRDATDGDGKLSKRNAELLNRDGGFGDLPELQRFNREVLEKYAPEIAARLQKPVEAAKAAQEATRKAVEDFSEKMAGVQERSAEAVRKIAEETVRVIVELEEQRSAAWRSEFDELRAQLDAKGNQPSSVPGGV